MPWDHNYRRLEEGEVIRATDEVQLDNGGWRTTRPEVAGTRAPCPDYTSHRVYRRLKENTDAK